MFASMTRRKPLSSTLTSSARTHHLRPRLSRVGAHAELFKPLKEMIMYGKAPKMSTPKKKAVPVTVMVAVGKPKPLPKRGQRVMTNKMTRGKK